MSDQVKAEIKNAQRNREERLQAREEVEKRLEKLKQGNFIRDIDDAFSDHVKRLSGRLKSFLQSDDVNKRFARGQKKICLVLMTVKEGIWWS